MLLCLPVVSTMRCPLGIVMVGADPWRRVLRGATCFHRRLFQWLCTDKRQLCKRGVEKSTPGVFCWGWSKRLKSAGRGGIMKVKVNSESCSVVSDFLRPYGLYSPWNSPGQTTGVGSLSLLQGIFPTQGSNPGLLHCRWILCQLSYQGSPVG